MALLSGLPSMDSTPPPAPIAESLPVEPAGVMRTALFGTAERLSSYSATDLRVDVATPNGTTVLMAAAPDVDKVRLLLARGAVATFRSPSGNDAATAAASYRGSAAAIRALLDAGAAAEPPESVKARQSPLLLASMSGDLETVSLLLARGASANPRPNPSGNSPISEAITFGRGDIVRVLIRSGREDRPCRADRRQPAALGDDHQSCRRGSGARQVGCGHQRDRRRGFHAADVRSDDRLWRHRDAPCIAGGGRRQDDQERIGQDSSSTGPASRSHTTRARARSAVKRPPRIASSSITITSVTHFTSPESQLNWKSEKHYSCAKGLRSFSAAMN